MSAKTDYLKINKFLVEFIESLSDEDIKNLLSENASLILENKKFSQEMITKSIEEIKDTFVQGDISELFNNSKYTNDFLMEILEVMGVTYRKKDTKKELIDKIITFLEVNQNDLMKQNFDDANQEKRLNSVIDIIKNSLSVDEATKVLMDKDMVRNKNELLQIAKELHVYFSKEPSYDRAVASIVDNVVGAKIRSLKIRNEFNF